MGKAVLVRPQARAQAQAHDQQVAIKSMTESLELVRCLLRVVIPLICSHSYMRLSLHT